MAENLPISWLQFPQYLNPCRPLGGDVDPLIYWMTEEDSMAPVTGRISRNQSSSVTQSFFTNFDSIADPAKQSILFRTILGGWDSIAASPTKRTPMAHPYLANFYATDIVGISPMGKPVANVDGGYSDYDVCRVVVNFDTLNYKVSPGDLAWIEPAWTGTNSRITQYAGQYKYKDTDTTVTYGIQAKRPEGHFGIIIHDVSEDQIWETGWVDLLDDGATHGFNLAYAFTGYINDGPFFGLPEHSVLLDSISTIHTWNDYDNKLNMDLQLNFIWIDWTWDKLPLPSGGALADVVNAADNATPPFQPEDLSGLISILNP